MRGQYESTLTMQYTRALTLMKELLLDTEITLQRGRTLDNCSDTETSVISSLQIVKARVLEFEEFIQQVVSV